MFFRSQNMLLKDYEFVDLYIGVDFIDVSNGDGRKSAPECLKDEITQVREKCVNLEKQIGFVEFSLLHDDILYRVTTINDLSMNSIFILRKSMAEIRELESINLPMPIMELINTKDMDGLILIAGKMRNGKTTTASSLMKYRLEQFGGVGVAIEDPPETRLHGLHGTGRCLQIAASRLKGGYKEQIIIAMRTGADLMFIGEIRDTATAVEAVNASINGHMIISTIHAGSVQEAIEKLHSLCDKDTKQVVADGIKIVIYQEIIVVRQNGVGAVIGKRLELSAFIVDDTTRFLIRDGDLSAINQQVSHQSTKLQWDSNGTS
ncbi:Flp pilus assembly complex ATPase component TadA [Yersinia enterocolitica]|nr:Flp pilus assembly complex ATPase component TadA [Yersinia enterocolitica]EKN3501171.1 Flp pilus assembly complex ATPase component TadA [Yersinia enterocolitica]EKN3636623.1 Flp pilus assembly complex ATPase component TadA [Yersinia enterocolitica]EKN3687185.1 Flp pilus assembly complex ATPase component TadA [Yersinia enterocolitica]EKN3832519.1 Flp pilus assembly complex ATPase component TadA [Yersinia enterocolitica]